MKQKPSVYIIATGGTIAGQADNAAATVGYKAGELTVKQLITSVPGLYTLADISGEQLCNIDSKDMQEDIWLRLAKRVNEITARNDINGIVITHGTDTMEETAWFLQLALHTDKPVILTGAMRPSTSMSADGPMNIWQAVRTAADESASGRGVLIVMNDQIHTAKSVTKSNANALQAFQAPGHGPTGTIISGEIFWHGDGVAYTLPDSIPNSFSSDIFFEKGTSLAAKKTSHLNLKPHFSIEKLDCLPKVKIIYGYVGGDDILFLDAALKDGAQGIVYAACGNGSVPEKLKGMLKDTTASGIPAVIASRCPEGIVTLPENLTENDHLIGSGSLNPQKAKILLQLALTKTNNIREMQKIFTLFK